MIVIVSITMFIISSSIIVRRPVPSTSNVCIDARCIRTSHVSTSDGRSISSRDFSARPLERRDIGAIMQYVTFYKEAKKCHCQTMRAGWKPFIILVVICQSSNKSI